jgi:hypothetical protein
LPCAPLGPVPLRRARLHRDHGALPQCASTQRKTSGVAAFAVATAVRSLAGNDLAH